MFGVRCSCLAALMATLLMATEGYKVLVVFPVAGKSHSLLGEGYVKVLLEKGHEVTYITPFPMKMTSANLTQVTIGFDMSQLAAYEHMMNIASLLKGNSMLRDGFAILFMSYEIARLGMAHENIQNMLLDTKQKFDVVVAEWFFSEFYAGFAAVYQCPMVWFSSMDVHSMILRVIDELPNPAYTADAVSASRPPFTFFQRVQELWTMVAKTIIYELYLVPKTAGLYKELYGPAATKRGIELPPYEELIRNTSFILANGHPSLGEAPKLPQNVKEIGGYHIERKTEKLPKDLQKNLDEAKHGVIYFSMGSNMKSKDLPADMKTDLLKVFGQLKQTVLWKFEENLEGVPRNVHIRTWMPQHSILAHPNTKLFITHGGLLSTTETVHFGVPVIVIPLFGDQFLNADMAVRRGIAVPVQFTYNLANDLIIAIQEAIGNPSYAARVKQLSSIYHDRPLTPADELVYWLEYAVRTGGAAHLRSPALLLPWYQKLYLDLLALVLVAVLAAAFFVKKLCRLLCRFVCRDRKSKTD